MPLGERKFVQNARRGGTRFLVSRRILLMRLKQGRRDFQDMLRRWWNNHVSEYCDSVVDSLM
jgi:hypothetical protein